MDKSTLVCTRDVGELVEGVFVRRGVVFSHVGVDKDMEVV